MKTSIRRGIAATVLAGSAIFASAGLAAADTLIHTSANANGTHTYTNARTGATIISSSFLGHRVDIACQAVQ
ncbi:hypothetical protein [Aeromicrobium sp.]|uniref:hypothetical protein n=1 Tax=Aeromicrobium sp. TaxID=1871063 RepID=UPI0028A9361F|nr:hypothetical protein [Aeromicrobium sp.]